RVKIIVLHIGWQSDGDAERFRNQIQIRDKVMKLALCFCDLYSLGLRLKQLSFALQIVQRHGPPRAQNPYCTKKFGDLPNIRVNKTRGVIEFAGSLPQKLKFQFKRE